ncbi:MAG: hypothetical protein CMN30_22260 [Sandaracinus sp.]|nr:hypothetical protein [Sandaracinus sp.]
MTLKALQVVVTAAYPVAVIWALWNGASRSVGLITLVAVIPMLAIRVLRSDRRQLWPLLRLPLTILALVAIGAVLDEPRLFLFMPALISATLLVQAIQSLRGPMSLAERFARVQDPGLGRADHGPAKRAHYRQATIAWAIFFAVNGIVCAALASSAPAKWWAIYTGGIAYGLMFLVGAGEYLSRKYRFREYTAWPQDRALALLWPPPEPA